MNIMLDERMSASFYSSLGLDVMKEDVLKAKKTLLSREGAGKDYLGWIDLPVNYDKEEFVRIQAAAARIREQSQVLLVIGIGGSYLGARAAIEFLRPEFGINGAKHDGPDIYYAGNQLSTAYTRKLMETIGDRDFSINVISKSGTTTEPAIAFRIFKDMLETRYGKEEAAKRIYATTDREKGALKKLADANGYETFVVPDDVGGRFSVLTAVGLLPIAAAGIDIQALMDGAAAAREEALNSPYEENNALLYAGHRNMMYRNGKQIEILANFEPSLHYVGEWWKQLFGESEGKDQKGIFPASVDLTTDLHSMGQFIQDGSRILMETFLDLKYDGDMLRLTEEENDDDCLNYLAGRPLSFVNDCAMDGTMQAHADGGVPSVKLVLPDRTPDTLGALFYMLEFACGVSGYMLEVNPFNQPGVESYKTNMFRLLGKPGYEEE